MCLPWRKLPVSDKCDNLFYLPRMVKNVFQMSNVNLSFQNIIFKVKSMSRSKYVHIKCSGRKTVDSETKTNCKKYFFK